MTHRERWKRAVVHLEGAADSVPWDERIARIRQIAEAVRDQDSPAELQLDDSLGRDVRCRGSAIFLRDEGRRYLLTARHVVTNREAALIDERGRPGWVREQETEAEVEERVNRWVFPIIFRVPSLDELLARGSEAENSARNFLMNLQAGVTWGAPYTFSTPFLDLAVISLDQRDEHFADDLEAAGFEPIGLDDIADGPSREGTEIFSVGYPEATAVIGQQELHPAEAHWASAAVSLPVYSFGRIAMSHHALPFFWADISIYPGNSGGPVIENDKLIGIVSAQANVEGARIPFARVIVAQQLRPLLAEQKHRDNA